MLSIISTALPRADATLRRFLMTWTPYYDLLHDASEPEDYEDILHRMTGELKFHCETVRQLCDYLSAHLLTLF